MSDPSLELQRATVFALKSSAGVSSLVSDRVYDRVPQNVSFPFVQVGNFQTLDDGAECVNGTEVFLEFHIWSRAVGQVEAKQIASAVHTALHNVSFVLAGYNLIDIRHRDTRVLLDADGLTTHAIVNFRALVDQL